MPEAEEVVALALTGDADDEKQRKLSQLEPSAAAAAAAAGAATAGAIAPSQAPPSAPAAAVENTDRLHGGKEPPP